MAPACTLSKEGLEPEGAGTGAGSSSGGGGAGAGATGAGSTTGGAGTGASATGGAGGAGECGVDALCVPAITEGTHAITGPEGVSACPAGWAGLAVYGAGIDPGCEACGNCALPGSCPSVTVDLWTGSNCNTSLSSFVVADAACLDVDTAVGSDLVAFAGSYRVSPPTPSFGACVPTVSNPAPLAGGLTACLLDGAVGEACDGDNGVCVPAGTAELDEVCAVVAANSTCPAALPAERVLSLVTADDRTCACSCGAESASCTGAASITGHADALCGGGIVAAQAANGVCNDTTGLGTILGILGKTGTYAGGCPGSDASSGSVTFGGQQKLCCAVP